MDAQEFIAQKDRDFRKEKERAHSFEDGEGNTTYWYREAWTFMQQSNYPTKVFLFDRFRMAGSGELQYRISFYGYKYFRWDWSRSCPLIPVEDLQPLLDKARREGTLL
jgi:hypothetical protein